MKTEKNYLFLDFGTSGTKYLAYLLGLLYGGFVPSGVRSLYEEPQQGIKYRTGCGVVRVGDRVYRVGEDDDIRQSAGLKVDLALVKSCAILGSFMGESDKSVSLVIKLPAREYGHRAAFAREFREALKSGVLVNGQRLNVQIESMYFHFEGSGLGPKVEGRSATVIVGHTDLNVNLMLDGLVDGGASQTFHGYGMGRIAKDMGLSHMNESEIAYAVMRNDLKKLARRKDEYEEIKILRDEVVAKYFEQHIKEKLSLVDWSGLKSVPIGGGGGPLFRAEMPKNLIPVAIAKPIKTPGLKLFGSRLNSDRFADIYGSALEFIEPIISKKLSEHSDPAKAVLVEVV